MDQEIQQALARVMAELARQEREGGFSLDGVLQCYNDMRVVLRHLKEFGALSEGTEKQ